MTQEQDAFALWCSEQGVPFACANDLRSALANLTKWGASAHAMHGLGYRYSSPGQSLNLVYLKWYVPELG